VVTSDPEQAKRMRMLRDWGQEQRYHHLVKGFNYRMDALQGAILRVKLRHLEKWTEARRQIAHRYSALLRDSPIARPPAELPGRRHVYHIYAVRTRDRDGLRRVLEAEGVQTGLHYPIPVHLQPAHADLGYRPGDFPESEAAACEVLSLPIHPDMSLRQAEQVVAKIEQDAYVD
jgi:dTDP-4-amino-4,6-dideoxygalactose transaminase